jgi:enoyl-CoA hydratase
MDGICFGGGLGVSVHGSVRIVTERSQLAMPETAIGLSPDVGALFWFARMPGAVGTYAALTGARIGPADAIDFGLADLFRPSDSLGELVEELRQGAVPHPAGMRTAGTRGIGGRDEPAMSVADESAGSVPLDAATRGWIDACFAADTVEEIAELLTERDEAEAHAALRLLRSVSPTALKVALAAIRRAADLPTVSDVLDQDLVVSTALTTHPDLAEGIRAMLVDKDRRPRWHPGRWEDVPDADIARIFYSAAPAN